MIDFTRLDGTIEKLVVLFLSVSPPMRLTNLVSALCVNKGNLINTLNRLQSKGLIESVTNEFGAKLYRYADRTAEYAQRTEEYADRTTEYAQRTKEYADRTEKSPKTSSQLNKQENSTELNKRTKKRDFSKIEESRPLSRTSEDTREPLGNPPVPGRVDGDPSPLETPPVRQPSAECPQNALTRHQTPVSTQTRAKPLRNGRRAPCGTLTDDEVNDMPSDWAFDGVLYSRGIDNPELYPLLNRDYFLDRMLSEFADIDRTVSNAQANVDGILLPRAPHRYLIDCLDLSFRHLYGTPKAQVPSTTFIRDIYEEINFRLGFAIAMHASPFLDRLSTVMFLQGAFAETDNSARRRNAAIYPLRIIYYREGWGWEPKLLSTVQCYAVEQERSEPRDAYYIVRKRQKQILEADAIRHQKKAAAAQKDAELKTTEEQRTLVFQKVEAKVNTVNAALQEKKIGVFRGLHPSFLRTKGLLDPAALDEFLDLVEQKSSELQELSTFQFGEASVELKRQGWRQYDPSPNIWLPPGKITEELCSRTS